VPSEATLHAFGLAGVVASLLMQRYADPQRPNCFLLLFLQIGIGMLIAGVVSHNFWIISKLQATPTWFFYCCSIFFPLFAFIYLLTDVLGKSGWFKILAPAGKVTLTCYIIPYVWYSLQSLLQVSYPEVLTSGLPGLLKSVVYSFLILAIAWGLMKINIKLKV
jgi:predicted acyltransferase